MRTVKRLGESEIRLEDGGTKSGSYTYGFEWSWHQARRKGGYNEGRDFFWVHFEIGHNDPYRVKLHVESPPAKLKAKSKATVDTTLNGIKARVVSAFLDYPFEKLCSNHNLAYCRGAQSDLENLQQNLSTQAFSVILSPSQIQKTADENIVFVINLLGPAVWDVLLPFKDELDDEFLYS